MKDAQREGYIAACNEMEDYLEKIYPSTNMLSKPDLTRVLDHVRLMVEEA